MKKIVIHKAGSYNQLQIEDHPDLAPRDHEVLIQVKGIGINYADVCVRFGVYESAKEYIGWPITPGFEVAGIVQKVGSKVTKFKPGDEVVGFTLFNAYATQASIHEDHVLAIPKGFSMYEAAGFPAVFFTAYHALYQQAYVPAKSKILIHSAAGGVGTALTQLCKAAGHFVVGVIGSSHKREYLEQFGPDAIIDKSKQDLWKLAKKFAPSGYQIIFDANGAATMRDSYHHLRPTGKLIIYGAHSLLPKSGGKLNYLKAGIGLLKTPRFAPMDLISSNKGVLGFNLSFLFQEKELINDCIKNFHRMTTDGSIKPIPITTFPFEEVAKAHQLIESGKSVGKIVLTVD